MIAYIRFILGMIPVMCLGWLILETCSFKADSLTKFVLSFGVGLGITSYLMLILGLLGRYLFWWTIFLSQISLCTILAIYLKKKGRLSFHKIKRTHYNFKLVDKLVKLKPTNIFILLVVIISSLLILYQTSIFPGIGWDIYSYWYPRSRVFFEQNQALCMPPVTWSELQLHWHSSAQSPLIVFSLAYTFFQIGSVDIVVSHLLNGMFGLGALCLTYILGKEMFGRRAGIFSAFLTACTSLWYYQSIRVTGDIYFAFYVLATVYLFYRFYKNPSLSNTIVTGLVIGMLGMTKPQSVFVIGAIFLFCILLLRSKKTLLMSLIASTPLILWYGRILLLFGDVSGESFFQRFIWLIFSSGKYNYLLKANNALFLPAGTLMPSFFDNLSSRFLLLMDCLFVNLGLKVSIPIIVLIILGIIICLRKFETRYLLYFGVLAFIPVFFAFWSRDSTRYFLPSILLLIIFGGKGLDYIFVKVKSNTKRLLIVSGIAFSAISNVFGIETYLAVIKIYGMDMLMGALVLYCGLFCGFIILPTIISKVFQRKRKIRIVLLSILASVMIFGLFVPIPRVLENLNFDVDNSAANPVGLGIILLARTSDYWKIFYQPFAGMDVKLSGMYTSHIVDCANYLNSQNFNGTFLCADMGIVFFLDNHIRERSVYFMFIYDEIYELNSEQEIVDYFLSNNIEYVQLDPRQKGHEKLGFIFDSESFEKVFEEGRYERTIFKVLGNDKE